MIIQYKLHNTINKILSNNTINYCSIKYHKFKQLNFLISRTITIHSNVKIVIKTNNNVTTIINNNIKQFQNSNFSN